MTKEAYRFYEAQTANDYSVKVRFVVSPALDLYAG